MYFANNQSHNLINNAIFVITVYLKVFCLHTFYLKAFWLQIVTAGKMAGLSSCIIIFVFVGLFR